MRSGAKVCKSCRSRQELSNEYLVFACKNRLRYSRERASQSLPKINQQLNKHSKFDESCCTNSEIRSRFDVNQSCGPWRFLGCSASRRLMTYSNSRERNRKSADYKDGTNFEFASQNDTQTILLMHFFQIHLKYEDF